MFELASKALLPWHVRALLIAALAVAAFFTGWIQGAEGAAQAHLDYVAAQQGQTRLIARAQAQVVQQVQVEYRDRIRTVYLKGEEIEKQVPVYVTPADDDRFGVNAGFVRHYNAAWTGEAAGPAADADRDPATVSLADIADAEAFNATVCRAWREQALGLIDAYTRLQRATNAPPAADAGEAP